MKTDLFQSCGHCWVFQICWHIECSTFTASSFRMWNSSAGTPSHPLALFIVILSKAHLTLHSRMSGSRWVITPLWLSRSWRSFSYSSSVYSCYLLVSSASVRPIPFQLKHSCSDISPVRASQGRRAWQPTAIFLPGESHGQSILAGYSPWGHKESDMTEWLSTGLPTWLSGKESTFQCRRCEFNPWVGKIPYRRKWWPTPVFLTGESHAQRSLAGYSPWGHKRVRHDLVTKTTGIKRKWKCLGR